MGSINSSWSSSTKCLVTVQKRALSGFFKLTSPLQDIRRSLDHLQSDLFHGIGFESGETLVELALNLFCQIFFFFLCVKSTFGSPEFEKFECICLQDKISHQQKVEHVIAFQWYCHFIYQAFGLHLIYLCTRCVQISPKVGKSFEI